MFNDLHIPDLLPEYVLGSLEEKEARQVAEHLTGCYSCRQELAAYQTVADQLPLAVPQADPSAGLRRRLTERIQRLSEPAVRPVETKHMPLSTARPAAPRWMPVRAFAAVVVILMLAVSNLVLWQRLNNLEVISGPLGMRAIALQNTAAASIASGFVVMGVDGDDGVLVVDNLPLLDESHEYQAWLERDGVIIDAGVFSVDEGGYRGLRLSAPESLLLYSSLFVTLEPAGGSKMPTGAQVLNGSLFNR